MTADQPVAITLYVPDRLLPVLNGEGLALRAILDGVPELDFLVPRWWESAHTVRLGALKPAGGAQPQTDVREETD